MYPRIPVTACLALGLTGCADDDGPTIVGNWRLIALGGETIPEYAIAGYDWPLHIKEDLSGEFLRYVVYDGERSLDDSYDLRIDASDAPRYRIDWLDEDGELALSLDCTLDGDILACDVDDYGYTWERDE